MRRRGLLVSLLATPLVVRTPGLLMPIKPPPVEAVTQILNLTPERILVVKLERECFDHYFGDRVQLAISSNGACHYIRM